MPKKGSGKSKKPARARCGVRKCLTRKMFSFYDKRARFRRPTSRGATAVVKPPRGVSAGRLQMRIGSKLDTRIREMCQGGARAPGPAADWDDGLVNRFIAAFVALAERRGLDIHAAQKRVSRGCLVAQYDVIMRRRIDGGFVMVEVKTCADANAFVTCNRTKFRGAWKGVPDTPLNRALAQVWLTKFVACGAEPPGARICASSAEVWMFCNTAPLAPTRFVLCDAFVAHMGGDAMAARLAAGLSARVVATGKRGSARPAAAPPGNR